MKAARQYKPRTAVSRTAGKSPDVYERCKQYRTPAWKRLRLVVLQRDGWRCQKCDRLIMQKGQAHVHHKDGCTIDTVICDPSMLETQCQSCHSRTTKEEERNVKLGGSQSLHRVGNQETAFLSNAHIAKSGETQ